MSPALMQPSQDEIQREVENLRDIKRRSTLQGGPGVLILDPDLPTPGAQAAAAQASYWNPSDDSSSDSHSHEDASGSDSASDDPFHLFWVPANMHPEIDPGQFRAFLKEHAHTPAEATLERSESLGNSSLGRKKSMLSRQYRPSENDGVEDEQIVPLRRNRSSLYASSGPQLTIKDLEKLDELVEEASQSRDPSKLRSVLRRSLSMNVSPSGASHSTSCHSSTSAKRKQRLASNTHHRLVIDNLDHAMPDPGEDADAPIVVPRPGQILRRTARTKIRKQGQTGEGAHRFNATRRGPGAKSATPPPPPVPEPRSSSDLSSDHDHSDAEQPQRRRLFSNESLDGTSRSDRPESYSAEAFIFDAYARDDGNDDSIRVISPPPLQPLPRSSLSPPPPPASQEASEPVPPIQVVPPAQPTPVLPPLHHPLPQRASSLGTPGSGDTPSRSPSPVTTIHSDLSSARPESRPLQTPSTSSPAAQSSQGSDSRREKDKEKDKKGLFKWGGGEKKGKKDQREKEKDPGFFGALFGSKKKPEESAPVGLAHGQSGREAAVALLGASKSSRGYVPPTSPQPQGGVNNYSRYPIHVERAIYRLSHIKLANPRRALYEQVLISNLMFWYLGVINKTQQPQSQQQQTQQQQGQSPTEQTEARAHGQSPAVTGVSGPQKEREEKERAEVEQADSERGEAKFTTQGQTQGQQVSPQGRRGSLTKATPVNAGPRRAEQPVRGPQYDMQHRAMEQEYGGAFVGGARSTTGPPGIGYAAPPPGAMQVSMSGSVPLAASGPRRSRSPPLPAGSGVRYVPAPPSIPPLATQPQPQAQALPTSAPVSVPTSNPASPNLSSSPAQQVSLTSTESAPVRVPVRSLSANATAQVMGPRLQGQGRKAQSARAVAPLGARRPRTTESVQGNGEEEDVPLALWQQQQQQQQSLLSQRRR